jgi:hypothetical protein
MCNTSKKSLEKSSFNFEVIFEVFCLKKLLFFFIFDAKYFLVFVNRSQFSQSGLRNWKINIFQGQVGMISEKQQYRGGGLN